MRNDNLIEFMHLLAGGIVIAGLFLTAIYFIGG